jgi:hypothetical protein
MTVETQLRAQADTFASLICRGYIQDVPVTAAGAFLPHLAPEDAERRVHELCDLAKVIDTLGSAEPREALEAAYGEWHGPATVAACEQAEVEKVAELHQLTREAVDANVRALLAGIADQIGA